MTILGGRTDKQSSNIWMYSSKVRTGTFPPGIPAPDRCLQHMEQLKFNAICPAAPHVSGGFHHILPAFSGEAKDNMCDYFQAGSLSAQTA